MPSKNKSFAIAIVTLPVFLLFAYWNIGCLYWPLLLVVVIYGATWYFKFSRDHKRKHLALQERYVETAGEFGVPAQKTTPGSGWIGLEGLSQLSEPPESL